MMDDEQNMISSAAPSPYDEELLYTQQQQQQPEETQEEISSVADKDNDSQSQMTLSMTQQSPLATQPPTHQYESASMTQMMANDDNDNHTQDSQFYEYATQPTTQDVTDCLEEEQEDNDNYDQQQLLITQPMTQLLIMKGLIMMRRMR